MTTKDIKKLIEALNDAADYIYEMRNTMDDESWFIDTSDALKQVILYIKSEQPRVFAFTELPNLIMNNTVVYKERKDKENIMPTFVVACTVSSITLNDGFTDEEELEDEDYNITYRCWNKLPSDEQRNNTPWDSPNND